MFKTELCVLNYISFKFKPSDFENLNYVSSIILINLVTTLFDPIINGLAVEYTTEL